MIRSSDRGSGILIMAPHAGAIEPGTSELVLSVADNDLSFYLFEGIKSTGNAWLHITSTRFDEPKALSFLSRSYKAVAFHGERSEEEVVFLGGRDEELRSLTQESLEDAGFITAMHHDPGLQGISSDNICNRCISGAGLQLEVTKGLRRTFFRSLDSSGRSCRTEHFDRFVQAIRSPLMVRMATNDGSKIA